jgi:hypothetical protein
MVQRKEAFKNSSVTEEMFGSPEFLPTPATINGGEGVADSGRNKDN